MDKEIELITQSTLEDTDDTPLILMGIDTNLRKRKELTGSEDTNKLPNVTQLEKYDHKSQKDGLTTS